MKTTAIFLSFSVYSLKMSVFFYAELKWSIKNEYIVLSDYWCYNLRTKTLFYCRYKEIYSSTFATISAKKRRVFFSHASSKLMIACVVLIINNFLKSILFSEPPSLTLLHWKMEYQQLRWSIFISAWVWPFHRVYS